MATSLAKYACDECRTRKIRCTRESSGCAQCKNESRECVYSRSGVIRRRPRQPRRLADSPQSSVKHASPSSLEQIGTPAPEPRSQMDHDITNAQDSLRQYGDFEDAGTGTLAGLDAAYSSFWQGPDLTEMAQDLNMDDKVFIAFAEPEVSKYAHACAAVQRKGQSIFIPTPPEVIREVLQDPEHVLEKAYHAHVYGVLLTEGCLDDSYDEKTCLKFRWNLRIALDDAKLLLEPSEHHIEVLMMLGMHVQEISSPSFCWTMVSAACRMLQILGVNPRHIDLATRKRRLRLFWTLNAFDKNLSLIFGRSPNLHGSIYANIPRIPLQELLDFQPHTDIGTDSGGHAFTSMFGAHFLRQLHQASALLSDVWSHLYGNLFTVGEVKKELDDWYHGGATVLNACIVAEQQVLPAAALESMRLGIKTLEFNYHYLKVLIIRSKSELKDECVLASRQALLMLPEIVSDTSEVFNGVIWLLLYCPFTPFFVLFGEVLSAGDTLSSQKSMEAMAAFIDFLGQMRPKHPQAPKLYTIASTFAKYAGTALDKSGNKTQSHDLVQQKSNATFPSANHQSSQAIPLHPKEPIDLTTIKQSPTADLESKTAQPLHDLFSDPSMRDLSMDMSFWLPNMPGSEGGEALMEGVEVGPLVPGGQEDAYGFFADSNFDWFSFDANTMEY